MKNSTKMKMLDFIVEMCVCLLVIAIVGFFIYTLWKLCVL